MHTKFFSVFIFTNCKRRWAGQWFISHFCRFCQGNRMRKISKWFEKKRLKLQLWANFHTFFLCLSFESKRKLVKWDFPTRSKWESFGLFCQQRKIKCRFLVSMKDKRSLVNLNSANAKALPLDLKFLFSFRYRRLRLFICPDDYGRKDFCFIAIIKGN